MDEVKRADYVGREALAQIRTRGAERKLAGIEIEGDRIEMNAVPWAAAASGGSSGRVTSAIYSPRLKKNIGYAMMPAACTAPGTILTVTIPGTGTRKATVVPRPFIDPKKDIPKS